MSLTQKIERNELVAGDHIYCWRVGIVYTHHGIYVGENRVIHFTNNNSHMSGSSSISSISASTSLGFKGSMSCSSRITPYCGFKKPNSGVVLSCLHCFLKGKKLRRFQYGLTEAELLVKLRSGTCTSHECDPPQVVIHRAEYLLEKGFGDYNLFRNNCEDFALYCKTGLIDTKGRGLSTQVKAKFDVGHRSLRGLVVEAGTVGDFAAVASSVLRFVTIGAGHSQDDVIKVEVEQLHGIFLQRKKSIASLILAL